MNSMSSKTMCMVMALAVMAPAVVATSATSLFGVSTPAGAVPRPAFGAAAPKALPDDVYYWDGFGPQGMNGTVISFGEFQGKLIVGGDFTTAGGVTVNRIAAWDGSQWTALGAGFDGRVFDLIIFNNELVAGGSFHTAGGVATGAVAAWNGTAWHALGDSLRVGNWGFGVISLAIAGGKLVAAGDFTACGTDTMVAKAAAWDGSRWTGLGQTLARGPGEFLVDALPYQNGILAGGYCQSAGISNLAYWNGSAWSQFGGGSLGAVHCLSLYNGELVAGGQFTTIGGTPASHIARWDGSAWHPLGLGLSSDAYGFTTYDRDLVVTGQFGTAGGVPAVSVATWDGSAWSPMGSGLNDMAWHCYGWHDQLYIGGDFTLAGGKASGFIARWDAPVAITNRQLQITWAPSTYVLMGIPFRTTGTMASILEDDLGPYDTSKWRLGRWNPSTLSYQEYPAAPAFQPGYGYWMIQRNPVNVLASGTTTDIAAPVNLSLPPGWNMIADPYLFPVDWASVTRGPGIQDRLIGRSGGGYVDGTTLRPYQGYFVYNGSATAQTIVIPPIAAAPAGKIAAATDAVDGALWAIAVDATRGARFDRGNLAAISALAAPGADDQDWPEVPALPGDLSAWFAAPGEPGVRSLTRDVRAPAADGVVWDLVVRPGEGEGPITLDFSGVAGVPADYEVALLGSGVDADLRTQPSVTLPAGSDDLRLRLAVGKSGFVDGTRQTVPQPLTLAQNHPNPFNPRTTIHYSLPAASQATLAVYDVRGARVATLFDAQRPAGPGSVEWAGTNDRGAAVPSGVYFARLETAAGVRTVKVTLAR